MRELVRTGTVTPPFFDIPIVLRSCPVRTACLSDEGSSSSISGVAFEFYTGVIPASYAGALFFADYSRKCIWVIKTASPGPPQHPDNRELRTRGCGARRPPDRAVRRSLLRRLRRGNDQARDVHEWQPDPDRRGDRYADFGTDAADGEFQWVELESDPDLGDTLVYA